ncbi:MAG: tRNA dihydrouridine synthase DusB [Gammaproteobacteria bacterium]
MQIGPHRVSHPVVLAPMAGVTDKPFRRVCRGFGAGYAVSEMLTSKPELWGSRKSAARMDFTGETGLLAVQIAGSDPCGMADAARYNVANGAELIDINMGCPAKKVCRRWAGSALLRDESLVADILAAVVAVVDVPVTLKIRIGWHRDHVNGVAIARIAERSGISMLAVHGRTRDMLYNGAAEYDTIARIKSAVSIPVLANGDIDSPEKALTVLECTAADGLMIGRGAQGRPWLFRQISDYLATGTYQEPALSVMLETMLSHIADVHAFYGEQTGVRIARKHLRWYLDRVAEPDLLARRRLLTETSSRQQLILAERYFDRCTSADARSIASIQCRTGTSVALARCS